MATVARLLGIATRRTSPPSRTGTFIYVATMDLLPEAFHNARKRLGSFLALSIGIFVMLLVARRAGLYVDSDILLIETTT